MGFVRNKRVLFSFAFFMLVALYALVSFSGSVDAEALCDGQGTCCSSYTNGAGGTSWTCSSCSRFGAHSDHCDEEAYVGSVQDGAVHSAIVSNCNGCTGGEFNQIAGSASSFLDASESSCTSFSSSLRDNVDHSSFEETGLDLSQGTSFGDFEETSEISVQDSVVFEQGDVREIGSSAFEFREEGFAVSSDGEEKILERGEVFKAGSSGNDLFKVQGSDSGEDSVAEVKNLGSRCDGSLKKVRSGEEVSFKARVKDGQGNSDIVTHNYTLDRGYYPQTSFGAEMQSEGNTKYINQVSFDELGSQTRFKVGDSFAGMTIMDIGFDGEGLYMYICYCGDKDSLSVKEATMSRYSLEYQPEEDEQVEEPTESDDDEGFISRLFSGGVVSDLFN